MVSRTGFEIMIEMLVSTRHAIFNKTADCQMIVDQIVNIKINIGYIFDAVEKKAVVDQGILNQVRNIFYAEDQQFNHDYIPVDFTFMKKSRAVVPANKWDALNSTMIAASIEFNENNTDVSNALYGFHHPYDEEYYDRRYSD